MDIMSTIMPSVRFGSAIRKHHDIIRIATGVNAYSQVLSTTRRREVRGGQGELTLSIWMYDTLRYRYAVLLRMRLPLNSTPIGNIDCMNMFLVILTSLVPSSR